MYQIFIQCEAGSNQKHDHDEKTLEWKGVRQVSAAYPYPYGFVMGTTSADGGNVDCYVITQQPLRTGQIVAGQVIGLMEQFEGDELDHKVLARLPGEAFEIDAAVRERLAEFTHRLFAGAPAGLVRVGRFLEGEQAEAYLSACQDSSPAITPSKE